MLLGVQVTRLELSMHSEGAPTARYKETAMAVLACIVVSCSARLEALDLRMDWDGLGLQGRLCSEPAGKAALAGASKSRLYFLALQRLLQKNDMSCKSAQASCAHPGRVRRRCAGSCSRCTFALGLCIHRGHQAAL